ncbi:conjugal transfer protein TraF [candidate division KSB1 bacterium]|nr:conjugal transfer protein TraF [candidate division KSB1 bacterium]
MKHFIYITLCVILVGIMIYPVNAQNAKPVFLNDVRSTGMGGAGVASARGNFCFVYNPALLTEESFRLTIPGVQIELGDNFMEIVSYINDNNDNFEKLNDETTPIDEQDEIMHNLRKDAAKLDNIWYRTKVTPDVGLIVGNLAIGFYSNISLSTKLDVGVLAPKVKLTAINDMVVSAAYAFHLNEQLSLGVGAKFISRAESPVIKIQMEESSGLDQQIQDGLDEMQDAKGGFGLDIGALYKMNERLYLAGVAQDLIGKIDDKSIPMNVKFGAMYKLTNRLMLAADLEDFFNQDGDNLFNKMYLGAEFALPIISLRGGFSQGYPAFGAGINLKVINIAYTLYTRELTGSPGLNGETYHMVGLNFGW